MVLSHLALEICLLHHFLILHLETVMHLAHYLSLLKSVLPHALVVPEHFYLQHLLSPDCVVRYVLIFNLKLHQILF